MDEKTDELARNMARWSLANRLDELDGGYEQADRAADAIADTHTVTWERDVNSAGVAVRRYVLRGAWEVDPEVPRGASMFWCGPCGKEHRPPWEDGDDDPEVDPEAVQP